MIVTKRNRRKRAKKAMIESMLAGSESSRKLRASLVDEQDHLKRIAILLDIIAADLDTNHLVNALGDYLNE